MDQIAPLDGAAYTLLAIQYNLVAGTLAPFALKRPELQSLLTRIMNFDVLCAYLDPSCYNSIDGS
jgi:acyl-CoA oxidase